MPGRERSDCRKEITGNKGIELAQTLVTFTLTTCNIERFRILRGFVVRKGDMDTGTYPVMSIAFFVPITAYQVCIFLTIP